MGERTPSSVVSKRLTFFPESRCLRQENRTQENTGLFLRKADWLLFGNTRKEAPSMVLFCSSASRDTDNNDRTVLVRFPKKSEQAFLFSPSEPPAPRRIRVARSTYLTVPCAQQHSPRRAVPRRTAPSHTGPHPCFVLFQREPPLFCLPQRVVRRKMRVTKRQFALATNEPIPKGCCFFFPKGLPECGFGRRASVSGKQVRKNGTEWGCKSSFQKTEVSGKKRRSSGIGRGMGNGSGEERRKGKRGRRSPNISAAPLITPQ